MIHLSAKSTDLVGFLLDQLMTQTQSARIFGAFTTEIPASEEYLTLHFSPNTVPRRRRWGNYGLSADFLGDYFAAFFPGDTLPDSKLNQRDTVKAAVSYIANELLENAVKYNDESAQAPVSICLHLYQNELIFQVVNYADANTAEKYQAFIQQLTQADLDTFYMQQLEKAATGTDSSCMGILTMMNDYGARFGWRFQPLAQQPEITQIEVLVALDV